MGLGGCRVPWGWGVRGVRRVFSKTCSPPARDLVTAKSARRLPVQRAMQDAGASRSTRRNRSRTPRERVSPCARPRERAVSLCGPESACHFVCGLGGSVWASGPRSPLGTAPGRRDSGPCPADRAPVRVGRGRFCGEGNAQAGRAPGWRTQASRAGTNGSFTRSLHQRPLTAPSVPSPPGFRRGKGVLSPSTRRLYASRGPCRGPGCAAAKRTERRSGSGTQCTFSVRREDPVLPGQRRAVRPWGAPEPARSPARRETGARSRPGDTKGAFWGLPDFQWGGKRTPPPAGQKDGVGKVVVDRKILENCAWVGSQGEAESASLLHYPESLERKALGRLEGRATPSFAGHSPVPSVERSPRRPSESIRTPSASAPSGTG